MQSTLIATLPLDSRQDLSYEKGGFMDDFTYQIYRDSSLDLLQKNTSPMPPLREEEDTSMALEEPMKLPPSCEQLDEKAEMTYD